MKTTIKGGWLTVNRACNMRCPWCYASATSYDKSSTMPIVLARQLVKFFKEINVNNLIILGGEPTIYKHLFEVLDLIITSGIRPVIVTNGIKLSSRRYVSLLKERGLRDLTISLKAMNASDYQKLSRNHSIDLFSKVCKAMANAQELGFNLNISITLVRSFLEKLDDLVRMLTELSVKHVTIDLGSPVVSEEKIDASGLLNPYELSCAITSLHQKLRSTPIDYSFNISIPLCILDIQTRNELIGEGRILTTCHVPKGKGLVFTPDGAVIPCNHFSSFPIAKFGVDFSTPKEFVIFWNSEKMAKLRSHSRCYPHKNCQDCADWDRCGGGCFVKWLFWDPNNFIPTMERR